MAIPIKTVSCIECTHKSACFKRLSTQELIEVDKKRFEVNYKKGENICKQGAFASHIMFVKKGLIKIYLEGKDKNLIIAIVPEGKLIGIPSLFSDPIFHYSGYAYEDSTICLIDIDIFRKFTRENALFASEVINIVNVSTLQTYDRFFSISQKNVAGRFADLVLYLSESIFKKNTFKIPLTRKDLAELASISIESLSRVIKEFNDDKIVKMTGKELKILSMDKLRRISQNS